ncbi:MAG TPA: LysM peptidoglycan-binding domain-containing protein [Anaerolineales bacterium]
MVTPSPLPLKTQPPAASGRPAATSTGTQAAPSPTPGAPDNGKIFHYSALSGDTLAALAGRFGVSPDQISSAQAIPPQGYLAPGQELSIPDLVGQPDYSGALLPDSELINSPSAADFRVADYVTRAGGYLSTYQETVDQEMLSGAAIVERIATETSTNPRLLLGLLDYRSHWVTGQPADPNNTTYPLGFYVSSEHGLYKEMLMAAQYLSIGYYGWRQGNLTELKFSDGKSARISPTLNAGSVALQELFSKLYRQAPWVDALYGQENFPGFYTQMFGDPWKRAATVEPLFSPGLAQPTLELPFAPGERWSLTGGPHLSWQTGSPNGALDFSPVTGQPPCAPTSAWARASASGLVTRTSRSTVVIDLDGDGREQTGWVLVYLHVAEADRVAVGAQVKTDDPIGHPSCEGGQHPTGTHVHLARKYNGEWIAAGGPLPFLLSGWQAQDGLKPYQGVLIKGSQTVTASPSGRQSSIIVR